jgi:glycosyltransferase involved in cell wall biosynthesis
MDWVRERADTLGVSATFVESAALRDLGRSYGTARVVAVPSRFESFSLVALEAMAAGRPVVCTNRVGASEVIAGTGAGTIFHVGDADGLASALRPYLLGTEHATEAGAVGRAIADECTPPAIAAQRETVYDDVVRHRVRAP